MSNVIIPEGYEPILGLKETQRAIKKIKDYFQQELAYGLQLRRVSAPLFVFPETGFNDTLNGVDRRVDFTIKDMNERQVEIVQSLAKWKRMALYKYEVEPGHGIYTDMNAIRRDEELDITRYAPSKSPSFILDINSGMCTLTGQPSTHGIFLQLRHLVASSTAISSVYPRVTSLKFLALTAGSCSGIGTLVIDILGITCHLLQVSSYGKRVPVLCKQNFC